MGNTTTMMLFQDAIDSFVEVLNSGDPTIKEWFLVSSSFWPVLLSSLYFITAKKLGPALMRGRKPFELRKLMIIYNLLLALTNSVCSSVALYLIFTTEEPIMCSEVRFSEQNEAYNLATCIWILYILKYIEFLDTIFFILRKKENHITNLHVIHHTLVPIIFWITFRIERSCFQIYVPVINSIVHTFMYSYYGLSAIGLSARKYLWWKRHLTIMQMMQFILVIFIETVMLPLMGCMTSKISIIMHVSLASVLLGLFYSFYDSTFRKQSKEKSF